MHLNEISNGQISGTGTLDLDTNKLGGINMFSDGTNPCECVLRDGGPGGRIIFEQTVTGPQLFTMPLLVESGVLHYTITGIGATVEFFEWSR